jgi:HPt (histidine-containing phosphotransfer) domain-containing protein
MTLNALAETLQRWVPGRITAPPAARSTTMLPAQPGSGGSQDAAARAWSGSGADEPPLDARVLAQLASAELGGDRTFVLELIDLFMEQAATILVDLQAARQAMIDTADAGTGAADPHSARAIGRIAHTLQSSAGNMGARRLQHLCADAELVSGRDRGSALAAATDALVVELERVMAALRDERKRTAA